MNTIYGFPIFYVALSAFVFLVIGIVCMAHAASFTICGKGPDGSYRNNFFLCASLSFGFGALVAKLLNHFVF